MATNFYQYLIEKDIIQNMPSVTIKNRTTDKKIVYDPKSNRLDRICGDVYGNEALTRIILWANPDYDYEFDIESGTVLRVPFPIDDVLPEVIDQIIKKKNI